VEMICWFNSGPDDRILQKDVALLIHVVSLAVYPYQSPQGGNELGKAEKRVWKPATFNKKINL